MHITHATLDLTYTFMHELSSIYHCVTILSVSVCGVILFFELLQLEERHDVDFPGAKRAHTRTAAAMLEPAAAAADRRRSRLASLPPRLRMSRMPPAPAELQDVDPKTARTRAPRTRRAPAEQQSRRVSTM